ncbi:MAG: membrane protein [Peptococcaceae bacterium BRH_c4b]|nr:MAG: membrane protein [Peptococcaceae bacterium BRH_c4b]
MQKTILATFPTRDSAERAIQELRSKGFENEISMISRENQKDDWVDNKHAPATGGDPVMNGAGTGGTVGGIIGLAAGVGALAIPGIGPVLAAGPIAGLLSGAATGGIAGGLVDWGIPAERGRFYEDKVKQGNIMVTVRCDQGKIDEAAKILRNSGGKDVETH